MSIILPFRWFSLGLLVLLLSSCSDDSTSPSHHNEPSSTSFSRVIGSEGHGTNAADLTVTSDGLRVVTGSFAGTLRVSTSSDSLVATDESDVFLLALQEDGTVAWERSIAGEGRVSPLSMARDSNNNFYIAGDYLGDAVFGTIGLAAHGDYDMLVAKVDAAGNPVWAIGGGGAGLDEAHDIAVGVDGSALVCGFVNGEITFAGQDMGEAGSASGFLARIDPTGVGSWAVTARGAGSAFCYDVASSDDGSVFVTGTYFGSAVEIGGETLPLDGQAGTFISHFTHAGAFEKNVRIGGEGDSSPYGLTEIDGEPVVVGRFVGNVDFDVNTPIGNVTSAGSDAFIARYRSDGVLRWVRTYGHAHALSVSKSGANGLVVCGVFSSTITLGSKTLSTEGGDDVFFAHLDETGRVSSSGRLGGPNDEFPAASVISTGTTTVLLAQGGGEIRFPDGTQRSSFGTLDGLLYQQSNGPLSH